MNVGRVTACWVRQVRNACNWAAVAVVVPDRHDDGNPVLAIPSAAEFRFAYGTGSCARHLVEARRCGLTVRVVRDRALGFDVDDASDLDALTHDRETTR